MFNENTCTLCLCFVSLYVCARAEISPLISHVSCSCPKYFAVIIQKVSITLRLDSCEEARVNSRHAQS